MTIIEVPDFIYLANHTMRGSFMPNTYIIKMERTIPAKRNGGLTKTLPFTNRSTHYIPGSASSIISSEEPLS